MGLMEHSCGLHALAAELTTQSPPLSSHQRGPWRSGQNSECISSLYTPPCPHNGTLASQLQQPLSHLLLVILMNEARQREGLKKTLHFLLQISEGEERADYMSKYDI